MKEVYLVIEYDSGIIYLPFKSIKDVDAFTVEYDNLLDLAASIGDILNLGIPNSEILDVYLSEDKSLVFDDTQEFDKRYLAVKYGNNDFDLANVKEVFGKYLTEDIKRVDDHLGLRQVLVNYLKKSHKEYKNLTTEDIYWVAAKYLGNDYIRHKNFYYEYKDKGYKFKKKKYQYTYKNTEEEKKELMRLLEYTTGYTIQELAQYIYDEINRGPVR